MKVVGSSIDENDEVAGERSRKRGERRIPLTVAGMFMYIMANLACRSERIREKNRTGIEREAVEECVKRD